MAPAVTSFSVGAGDMFCIRHGNQTFTIIDCFLKDDNKTSILQQLDKESKGTLISRFISTHPDEDHIGGLHYLDKHMPIANFYCVANRAIKPDKSDSFNAYCKLRDDPKKRSHIHRGYRRAFLNTAGELNGRNPIGSSGLSILWPDVDNQAYQDELAKAAAGTEFNNISIILQYAIKGGPTFCWMGDLETDFMEKIEDSVDLQKVNVLFLPHHGRKTGRVPSSWIEKMDPDVLVYGEAPSEHADYAEYKGRDSIRQNGAKDIRMEWDSSHVHFFSSSNTFEAVFLVDKKQASAQGRHYIGSLKF